MVNKSPKLRLEGSIELNEKGLWCFQTWVKDEIFPLMRAIFSLPLDYKGVRVFGDFAKTAPNMQ